MEASKEQILERARKVLLHPNFNKLSPQQIQQVFKSLLASGVTKEDIKQILNSGSNPKQITYLEFLPYNVFVNLVTAGEIKGKDLIALCNSSPLINEKCNKAFNAEGKIIPQYLFYLLLKKMGIDLNKKEFQQEFWRNGYRSVYRKIITHLPFFTLQKKFKEIEKITSDSEDTKFYPNTVYDLLYNADSEEELGFILKMDYYSTGPGTLDIRNPEFEHAGKIIDELYDLAERRFDYNITIDSVNIPGFKYDLEYFAGRDLENYIENEVKLHLENGITVDDLMNITDIFNDAVNRLFEGHNITDEEIKERIQGALESLQDLDETPKLSDDELNYLVYLHKNVLTGKLPVLTVFTFENLFERLD